MGGLDREYDVCRWSHLRSLPQPNCRNDENSSDDYYDSWALPGSRDQREYPCLRFGALCVRQRRHSVRAELASVPSIRAIQKWREGDSSSCDYLVQWSISSRATVGGGLVPKCEASVRWRTAGRGRTELP